MDAFISSLLPLHEGPVQAALVLINQPQFKSIHVVAVVLDVFFPGDQSFILDVAVSEVSLSQSMVLSLGSSLLGEALPLVLQFFTFWDFGLKDFSRRLELMIHVAEFNRVEALFQESFSSYTFNIAHKSLFSGKEFVLAALFTPVFPG